MVRPVRRDEVDRFNAELHKHNWLGHRIVGETMRYVSHVGGSVIAPRWRALGTLVGWSKQQQFARLRYVVNKQRFCVLPQARKPNLASAVLGRALRRLSGDYRQATAPSDAGGRDVH